MKTLAVAKRLGSRGTVHPWLLPPLDSGAQGTRVKPEKPEACPHLKLVVQGRSHGEKGRWSDWLWPGLRWARGMPTAVWMLSFSVIWTHLCLLYNTWDRAQGPVGTEGGGAAAHEPVRPLPCATCCRRSGKWAESGAHSRGEGVVGRADGRPLLGWRCGENPLKGGSVHPTPSLCLLRKESQVWVQQPGPRKAGVLSVMAPTASATTRGEAGPPLHLHARPAGALACGWWAQTHFTALTLQNLELGP